MGEDGISDVFVTPEVGGGGYVPGYGFDVFGPTDATLNSWGFNVSPPASPSSSGGFGANIGNIFAGIGAGLHNLLSPTMFPSGTFAPVNPLTGQPVAPSPVPQAAVTQQPNMLALFLIVGGAVLFLRSK